MMYAMLAMQALRVSTQIGVLALLEK